MARVNEGSHRFTCHPHVYPQAEQTIPAFTPQPQSSIALWAGLIFHPTESRSSLGQVVGYKPRRSTHSQTVTHYSTNRARSRVTSLIETNVLPPSQAATHWHKQQQQCLAQGFSGRWRNDDWLGHWLWQSLVLVWWYPNRKW